QLLAVDAPAEIEQILVLAPGLALGDDRLRGASADALDRAEPVADPPRAERRERIVRAIHVRRLELDAELAAVLAEHDELVRVVHVARTACSRELGSVWRPEL